MKVYKEKQESKGTITIIYDPIVNTDSYDIMLKKLSEITDLFFVFSKRRSLEIKTRKFSNLYEATYYGIQENDESESTMIYTALDYAREIGKSYLGFFILLGEIGEEFFPSIGQLGGSLIENSVWSKRRLDRQEIQEIYREDKTPCERMLDIFSFNQKKDISRMFETYTTDDKILFLREITLIKLDESFKSFPLYRRSFEKSSFQTFITSSVERFCPETLLNTEIINAKAKTTR